jgi:Tol biopolymer transport system component
MAETKENPLLKRAIALAQAGRVEDAHALLHKITSEDPTQEMAWLWLVQTEPDHVQRILILEECLRHNPQSEYARKGLAGLRTGPLTGKPPAKPPTNDRWKKSPVPRKRSSCRWRVLLLIGALAGCVTLTAAGILFYPQWKGLFPSLNLPDDPLALLQAPAATKTATTALTLLSPTVPPTRTRSPTPTATSTMTGTFTPTQTFTPTVTLTPTLFQGAPVPDEPVILFLALGQCEVMRVPISGAEPELLTKDIPADCTRAEISPDGQRMAYVASPDENTLQAMSISGSGKKTVAQLAANTGAGRTIWSLEWAPDGWSIAFVASGFSKDDQGEIQVDDFSGFLYVVSSNGGYARQMNALGVEQTYAEVVSWSPDGKWIFALDMGNPLQTVSYPFVFRVSDKSAVWIAREDTVRGFYDWSSDSRYMSSVLPWKPAAESLPDQSPKDQSYIILAGLDESRYYIPLADKGYDPVFGARWFPDSSAFLLYNEDARQLVAVTREGVVQNTVMPLEKAPSFVSWSRDGQWIAVVEPGASDEGASLMIAHPDGSDWRILARGLASAPVVWK